MDADLAAAHCAAVTVILAAEHIKALLHSEWLYSPPAVQPLRKVSAPGCVPQCPA